VAPNRYYVAKATKAAERTTHVALLSLFQTIGFILGPAIQAALAPIGESDVDLEKSTFHFDMYTACGYVGAFLGIGCITLFLPFFFEEFSAAEEAKEETSTVLVKENGANPNTNFGDTKRAVQHPSKKLVRQYSTVSIVDGRFLASSNNEDDSKSCWKLEKPDWLVTVTCCFNFFAIILNYVLGETTSTPTVMDQFAWSRQEAVLYLGITNAAGGVMGGLVFTLIGPLSKRYDERKLLIFWGLLPLVISKIILFPMGATYPQMSGTFTVANVTYETLGCSYDWCLTTPQFNICQYYISYFITICSYSIAIVITASLYSKALGNIPQGFWMGLLTTSGSLSRVVGPIGLAVLYQNVGIYYSVGTVAIALCLSLMVTVINYDRLAPKKQGS